MYEESTRYYFYESGMDREQFIQESAEKFLASGKRQLMLYYRVGVPSRSIRYINKAITNIVHEQKPETLIRMEYNLHPLAFDIHKRLVEHYEQTNYKEFSPEKHLAYLAEECKKAGYDFDAEWTAFGAELQKTG